ncbi:MAG: autotransporter domain-containing protein [Sphingobium sp.]
MRHLLAHTAISTVLVALTTGQVAAETTIATATTTAVKTSTAASGSADDVTVSSAGSITLTTGTAITQDSNNKASNAGALKVTGANGAAGIAAAAGTSGDIVNSGTITLDEDFAATDGDSDGDVDGAFAQGSGRNGILVGAGAAHVGAIDNSGTIAVEGNQSAGIRLDAALAGNLSTSGTISVLGDGSYGVKTGDVTGNITLRGTTSVVGAGSVGAAVLGDVDGALKIQGTILTTGYRTTARPSDVTKLDADDLLQGGSALVVSGNVSGGIIFDKPPTLSDTDTDVDDDGLTDSSEGTAAITAYGAAPAVLIGSATQDVVIGAVASDTSGYGLIVKGAIGGHGIYDGIAGNGMVIGGLGGDVSVAKGITVEGSIAAVSYDSSATGLRLGAGATAPAIVIAGSVGATGSALDGTIARALVIDAGASVNSLDVSGTLSATATSADKGAAIALLDSAGTLSSITNSGRITAIGGKSGSNVAMDLSANTGGVTLTQTLASPTAAAPTIAGAIRLGSGNDVVTLSAGSVTGDLSLGAGNDSVALSGSATYAGAMSFGGGMAALNLAGTSAVTGSIDFGGGSGSFGLSDSASYSGQLINAGATAVTVNGGILNATNGGVVPLASLAVAQGASIGVTIDADADTHTLYSVAGAANFATGSLVKATLTSVGGSAGNYVILHAGTLTGAPTLSTSLQLPYIFKGSVAGDSATGNVTLTIAAKTTAELGLSGSVSRAYGAIFDALDNDAAVADAFLAVADGQALTANLRQMLPDHAGGTFEAVTSGSRATARILSDPGGIVRTGDGRLGFWLQQVAFGSAKSIGDTASYDVNGWGTSGGIEYLTRLGAFGASLAYIHGSDSTQETQNAVDSDQFELATHWRGQFGPVQAFARLSGARIDFRGTRRFTSAAITRSAEGNWSGTLWSGTAGISYVARFGRVSLRPAAGVDYYRLTERSYSETGGGDAFNLIVGGRRSDELAASGTMTAGYDFGSLDPTEGWLRVELEGGRRQIVGGSIGDTVAHFAGGSSFTLVPEQRTNGWTGRARLVGGNEGFRLGGEFSAEEQQNHLAIAFRATVNFIL